MTNLWDLADYYDLDNEERFGPGKEVEDE